MLLPPEMSVRNIIIILKTKNGPWSFIKKIASLRIYRKSQVVFFYLYWIYENHEKSQ